MFDAGTLSIAEGNNAATDYSFTAGEFNELLFQIIPATTKLRSTGSTLPSIYNWRINPYRSKPFATI